MRISLYRIISEDLPPIHSTIRSPLCTGWILKNEPRFENCRKVWIFNKLTDCKRHHDLNKLIRSNGYETETIPFNHKMYSDYRESFKLDYVINNSAALNQAIANGLEESEVSIVLDSCSWLSQQQWNELYHLFHINQEVAIFMLKTYQQQILERLPTQINESNLIQMAFTKECDVRFSTKLDTDYFSKFLTDIGYYPRVGKKFPHCYNNFLKRGSVYRMPDLADFSKMDEAKKLLQIKLEHDALRKR